MYIFIGCIITLKSKNRMGDFLGLLIQNEDDLQSAISLDEAEELVAKKQIKGLKLETYTWTNKHNEVTGGGNLILFEDNQPILLSKTFIYNELKSKKEINLSDKIKEKYEEAQYK